MVLFKPSMNKTGILCKMIVSFVHSFLTEYNTNVKHETKYTYNKHIFEDKQNSALKSC
jgi:hypothetical protein